MVAEILKLYFIGTALSVLAFLYGITDSIGGLMYVQDSHNITTLDRHTQGQISSDNQRRGPPLTKNIGS